MKFRSITSSAAAALVLAAVAAPPRTTSAWCGPGRPYAVRPVVVLSDPSATVAAAAEWRRRKFFNRRSGFTQSSPRYEITDNDTVFQVAVDVPGVSSKDLSITLEEDGHVLSITGVRQSRTDSYSFATKFSQSFTVDPAVDVDQFTAKLENGVLIVAAPKDLKRIEDNVRSIPITTVKGPAKEDEEEEELTVVGRQKDSAETTTATESTDSTDTITAEDGSTSAAAPDAEDGNDANTGDETETGSEEP